MRCGIGGGFRLLQQRGALDVGGEHEIDQLALAAGRLLLDAADPGAARNMNGPAFGGDLAGIRRNSVVLPAPLRPTKPTRAAFGQHHAGGIEQEARRRGDR